MTDQAIVTRKCSSMKTELTKTDVLKIGVNVAAMGLVTSPIWGPVAVLVYLIAR